MYRTLRNLALLATLGLSVGQVTAEPAVDAAQKRRLAEQKLKLVEMLIDAPATKANAARRTEAPALLAHSRELTEQARLAIAEQKYETATTILDEALRNVFKTNSHPVDDSSAQSRRQKQEFDDFAEQLAGYRAALLDMTADPKNAAPAKKLLGRLEQLNGEARKLHAAGQLADGNKLMAEAYKLAVSEIAQLRAGQEVVMSLKFASPADEFAYELKRYQSNEILVSMMISEGRADGERRQLVDGFLGEADRLKEAARLTAAAADHKTAVGTMEKANSQLNRALQSMGVPVF